jgi:hypothetical protein
MTIIEERLREAIEPGLVKGLGEPIPGQMCIEAAICWALGEPHGENPSCVALPDRKFSIQLNDAPWSSNAVRAKHLLPLALAQLNTAGADRTKWVQAVVLGTIQRILPLALDAAGLTERAQACRDSKTLEEGRKVARATAATANAAAYADANAAAAYAAYAANAAAAYAAYAARATKSDAPLIEAVNVALEAYALLQNG